MSLTRLLVAMLLVCSASTFAAAQTASQAPTPAQPWQITSAESGISADRNPVDRIHVDQFKVDPKAAPFGAESKLDPIVVTPEGLTGDGTLCYTIRSYVVARDSKDSDSVHPVGYSTCQPAGRYRLKSAEIRVPGR